jgi:hypothetical protein
VQSERLATLLRPLEVGRPELPEGQIVLEGQYEALALGLRTQAEHLVVVREPDGHVAFCTRIVIPGGQATETTVLELSQRFLDRRMQSFDLSFRFGQPKPDAPAQEMTIRGLLIGVSMNVERRIGGVFLDNQRAGKVIDVIDVGRALTEIIMGQYWEDGLHYGLYFADLTPVESQWALKIDEQDHRFLVRTPQGPMVFGLDEQGVPVFSAKRLGSASRELRAIDVQVHDGPGLTLAASRRFEPPEAPPEPEPPEQPAQDAEDDPMETDEDR